MIEHPVERALAKFLRTRSDRSRDDVVALLAAELVKFRHRRALGRMTIALADEEWLALVGALTASSAGASLDVVCALVADLAPHVKAHAKAAAS